MSICESNKCTGCMACYSACSKQCISMKLNNYNILLPNIDKTNCNNCNLCIITCPVNNKVNKNKPLEAYACWNLDENDRKSSSSGGLASIFYSHFINNKKASAYGCSYDNNLKLKFYRATKPEELQKFKTSKYSFADIGNTYKEIKKDLDAGLYSIFISTPCQCAGLKNYLKKDYEKLLIIDLICHGVPPQSYLDEYIQTLNLKEAPDNLTFRGNLDFFFTLYKNNKIIYSEKNNNDKFYTAFLDGLFYRENCYSCEYANPYRIGDITLGDFWGIGKNIPFNHDTTNGTSLVLLNNKKGTKFFEEIKNKIFYEKRNIEEAIEGNAQLKHPSPKHKNYEKFLNIYSQKGIKEALDILI
ncbi:MAG: 4Fe-4S dicluster domain-containing protein [Clostridia bacterium]|nr:4Fe-4S dicluster domain-containing protein [Clostridia bacterium]